MRYVIWAIGSLFSLLMNQATANEGLWTSQQRPELAASLPLHSVMQAGSCSAALISAHGLLLTNYHCLLDSLPYLFSAEPDIFDEGYLAGTTESELALPADFYVSRTLSQRDVTDIVNEAVGDRLRGRARFNRYLQTRDHLVAECEREAGVVCRLVEFNDGLSYQLIREQRFDDVRLVYVPAAEIGYYGGERDNWQWPRHAGDFALLRLYVGESGLSSEPAATNRPYQPERFIALSETPLRAGDALVAAGYPGITQRYRSPSQLSYQFAHYYPSALQYLEQWQQLIKGLSPSGSERRIQYAPLLQRLSNRSKNYQAMLSGYENEQVLLQRDAEHQQIKNWIAQQPNRGDYEEALTLMDELLAEQSHFQAQQLWLSFFDQLQLPRIGRHLYRLAYEKQRPPEQRTGGFQPRDMQTMRNVMSSQASQFDSRVEAQLLAQLLVRHMELPEEQQLKSVNDFFRLSEEPTQLELEQQVKKLYSNSQLDHVPIRLYWMQRDLKHLQRSSDPWLVFAAESYQERVQLGLREREWRGQHQFANGKYMLAVKNWHESQDFSFSYNANRTLRMSQGSVMQAPAFTSLNTLLQQAEPPSQIPEQQKELIQQQDWGCYADAELQSVPVNFLSNLDATGGSSGAATFNQNAELVGLIFDSTAESVINDWHYSEAKQGSIHVDIRYLLWTLDKLEGGSHLLKELGWPWQDFRGECRGVTIPDPAPVAGIDPDPAG
ncbi:hypothetical protein CWE09_09160 [Aliidiomarina minuta]|uniref:Dipeptidyl-peptidase n=1 Tax=Aliidiomarina minuta TaxID=880057 RepID=A0A432W9K8_9GAMM|nr:S46 family peptidase [Aliidiomarina minuta]RUO26840.1 hypothetical protein CWE09_09160 [Aliidiomarina minuta]